MTTDPMPIIEALTRQMKRLADGDAWSAITAASFLAVYGRFAEADARLDAVAWKDKAPLVQAGGLSARAICGPVWRARRSWRTNSSRSEEVRAGLRWGRDDRSRRPAAPSER